MDLFHNGLPYYIQIIRRDKKVMLLHIMHDSKIKFPSNHQFAISAKTFHVCFKSKGENLNSILGKESTFKKKAR